MNTIQHNMSAGFDMTILRKRDVTTVDFDGEIAIMDINKGAYYYMDSVGSKIWETLQIPTTIDEIAGALILQYDVDIETCKKDVCDFILELVERNLALIL